MAVVARDEWDFLTSWKGRTVELQRKSKCRVTACTSPEGVRGTTQERKTVPDAQWASLHPLLPGLKVSLAGLCPAADPPQQCSVPDPFYYRRTKNGISLFLKLLA